MKKLNNKGFTLIELLAVIVILAIIMVVTIPTVLSSMNNARSNQLKNAANSAAEWFEKQYQLSETGIEVPDGVYTTWATGKDLKDAEVEIGNDDNGINVLKAAGISDPGDNLDLANCKVKYNTTTKRICVTLVAKSGGKFENKEVPGNNKQSSNNC